MKCTLVYSRIVYEREYQEPNFREFPSIREAVCNALSRDLLPHERAGLYVKWGSAQEAVGRISPSMENSHGLHLELTEAGSFYIYKEILSNGQV
jgi:hypothetical protein